MIKLDSLKLGPLMTNCYIIGEKQVIVIDPAGDFPLIKLFIDQNEIEVKYIILTHGHFDHTGALAELKEYTGAPVCIHRLDERCLREKVFSQYKVTGEEPPMINADIILEDGDTLECEGVTYTVMHTPGHTPGSICLHFCDNGSDVLISGDTMFAGSWGRTDFEGGDRDAMRASWKRITDELPPETAVLPGHGGEVLLRDNICIAGNI